MWIIKRREKMRRNDTRQSGEKKAKWAWKRGHMKKIWNKMTLGEWNQVGHSKISEMTAHIWSFKPEHRERVRGSHVCEHNGRRRDNGGTTGIRKGAHTLVAHHQVCQTLKENKSTVSREQGIKGSCVTLTCRHLFQSRCPCYLRSVGIGESGTERKRRRVHRQG